MSHGAMQTLEVYFRNTIYGPLEEKMVHAGVKEWLTY